MQVRQVVSHIIVVLFIFVFVAVSFHLLWVLGMIRHAKECVLAADVLAVTLSALFVFKCPVHWKKRVLFLACVLMSMEILLQAIAFFGLLPAVSFYYHLPYGRVYWSKEGLGNSMMNAYGWYYPSFELELESRKIVLIGDSFIQGVQISPRQNIGKALEDFLNPSEQRSPQTEVISLGQSGIGPAQYLEILDYSNAYFNPDMAVIFVYLGNDFKNCLSKEQTHLHPGNYIYYQMDEKGDIDLNPESKPALDDFRRQLRENHHPSFYIMAKTLCSYMILPQVLKTFVKPPRKNFKRGRSGNDSTSNHIQSDLRYLGIDDFIFKMPWTPDAEEAFEITAALLLKCHQYARAHDIELLFVTVPIFPKAFYEFHPADTKTWCLAFDGHDFLLPEKKLVDFARTNKMHILPMGRYIKEQGLTPGEIMTIYINGTGHWSASGHRFFAEAVYSYLTGTHNLQGGSLRAASASLTPPAICSTR